MKRFFKWFFTLILLAGLAGGGYYVYDNYIAKRTVRSAFGVVPEDAIFVIETANLTDGWKAISESNIWNNLLRNPYFNDINEYAELLNEFLKDNKAVDMVLRDRPMLISAHMISAIDYDFLFVIDLQSAKTLSTVIDDALGLISGYDIKKRKYKDNEIIEFIDKEDPNSIIYLSILDNLLIGTFTGQLMERTLDGRNVNYWEENSQYQQINDELSTRKLFKFHFNYKKLPEFVTIYAQDMEEYTASMAKALTFSAFDVNLEDNRLSLDGYSALDSIASYFSALCDVKPGTIRAHEIVSDQAALYLSIGFKNYNMFFQSLTDQYAEGNAKDMEDYAGNVKMVEKLLDINVQKDFFDWIGEEIAFIKLRPQNSARLEDVIVTIHAKSIDDARAGMGHIVKQIRKKSPLKFEAIAYKNHEINYLERKGIFKLFFGKLFKRLEKPYFTFIEDFVVFSNSQDALKEMIDDYLKGHTLSHNKEFMDFRANFDLKSNISLFIQMPKLYSNLYTFSNTETKNSVAENKDIILSFNRLGFQLIAENDMFKTILISDHNEDASLLDELEKFEQKASDDLLKEDFDSLKFKIILSDSIQIPDGAYRAYHSDNETIKIEGKVSNGLPNGLWRTYYQNGHLRSSVNYKSGKVDGVAFFFYNDGNETKLAEVIYKDDVIEGNYQEFFQNGAQKAKLTYEDGMLNGDAEFYYPTGRIKIKGKYKDNEKKGKWLFYDENGEVINKEKMKKKRN
ncbi:MAG: DUF3352 domain-containing protein [Bacteroidales bacterium]|nr:DUF3352 domain-containing protein [Bacteroidales bacterium]